MKDTHPDYSAYNAQCQRANSRFTYLDYVNNWITVQAMAAHYGKTVAEMLATIEEGKAAHEAFVAKLKDQAALAKRQAMAASMHYFAPGSVLV